MVAACGEAIRYGQLSNLESRAHALRSIFNYGAHALGHLHSAKGGAVETLCSGLYALIY